MKPSRSARGLLLFAKAPRPGQAKTRLIHLLGKEGAARLQQALIEHSLNRLTGQDWCTELWCAPDGQHPFFQTCQRRFAVSLHEQQGHDLGERMHHALSQALARYRQVVIVGSDCPALSAARVEQAFETLEAGQDAVIVPAEDGGYVLLGLRRIDKALFAGVAWGSGEVYRQSRERLEALGWSWRALAECWDVDRPQDYRRLLRLPDWPPPGEG